MKIRNIHSVVDLITNSSTTIYTQATEDSINIIKEIINTILASGESTQTADDLYEFSIEAEYCMWFCEYEAENLANFYENSEIKTKFIEIAEQYGYSERNKKFREFLDSINVNLSDYLLKNEHEENYNSQLVITPKAGVIAPMDLGNKLSALFTSHESYDD